MEEIKGQIIKAQNGYIKFLGKELGRHESMMSVGPYKGTDTDTIRQGIDHRNKIALLKDKIKETK
jgi:hypothetical protein